VDQDLVAALAKAAPDRDERVDVPGAPDGHDHDPHGAA
jgi:hypothetical protein